LGDPCVDVGIILKWLFRKCGVKTRNGFVWFILGLVPGAFIFHKMREISRLAELLLASQEGF